jgi:hypothetical protein
MEKIFKKSLALVLSAALCLTALVGCLTVSADETTTPIVAGKYEVIDAEGVVGKTAVIFADYTNISTICAHWVEVTFPAGIKVDTVYRAKTSISDEEGSDASVTTWVPLTAYSSDNDGWDYKPTENEDGTTVIESCEIVNFIKSDGSRDPGEENAELHFKFDVTIDKDLTPGAYNVTVAVKQAATQDEKWVAPATDDGVITVKAETPACDHANATKTEVLSVTETEFTYAIDCPDCEEENLTLTVPVNNTEIAGNKVSRTIKPGSDISLWFMFKKEQQADYSDLCLVVEKEVYEFGSNDPKAEKDVFYLTNPIDANNSSGALCDTFVFDKLAAYEMCNEVSVKLYGYSSAKEMQLLKTTTYSIRTFLETMVNRVTDEHLLKMYVDILNYGAASQLLSDIMINTDDLVNSSLSDVQKAYGTSASEYCDTNTNFVDNSKAAVYNTESPVGYVTPVSTIAPESKVNIYFKFRTESKDGTTTYFTGDVNNLYCRYYYTDVMGNELIIDRKYDGLMRDGLNAFKFDLQPVGQLDKAVKAVVYYGDPSDSSSYQIMEKEYSIEAFIKSQIGKATSQVKTLLQTMYAYGYSLKYCVENGLV